MATVIQNEMGAAVWKSLPKRVWLAFPKGLQDELASVSFRSCAIEELRLRRDLPASLSTAAGNRMLSYRLNESEIDLLVRSLCDGSLYAYRETIIKGYVALPRGIRVGIGGRAVCEGDRVIGVFDVSSLNFRFPGRIFCSGETVCRLLSSRHDGRGVLIFAPPGVGKTTLLRAVAVQMASGESPWRVAIVDTREELGFALAGRRACVDVLRGYPRALGIEIATRTLNAQLIVCDEIGDDREAETIVSAAGGGVPFLATAHADTVGALLARPSIARLHRARVFGYYVGIRRAALGEFSYEILDWEDANELG